MLRNMDKPNPRKFKNPKSYDFPKGTTGLIFEFSFLSLSFFFFFFFFFSLFSLFSFFFSFFFSFLSFFFWFFSKFLFQKFFLRR